MYITLKHRLLDWWNLPLKQLFFCIPLFMDSVSTCYCKAGLHVPHTIFLPDPAHAAAAQRQRQHSFPQRDNVHTRFSNACLPVHGYSTRCGSKDRLRFSQTQRNHSSLGSAGPPSSSPARSAAQSIGYIFVPWFTRKLDEFNDNNR
ncbi:hypothetical protein CALCODRAFT_57606 [Calocera cornea HHB12733]|uniref:Uncharacterized protein n=1 Tax=Calocera cornea HHB12733 TaxID=1353952 RepID=A0A165IV15_9BASI|nr:hypothetical protein CALCODRAFT_57606 [Calocera cornea HHB12733]